METMPSPESRQEKPKISEVVTARGSIYKYLPDGRTERFKTATQEQNNAQDVLVFIPPYDLVIEQARKLYPEIFRGIENQILYEQLLLEYAQGKGRTIRVVDEKGKELSSNKEVELAARAFAYFVDKQNQKNSFFLPISKEPKIGYQTYDTRKYKDADGETYRERHLGNKVTEIRYN